MVSKKSTLLLVKHRAKTYYERWMEKEGVPVIDAFAVTDVQKVTMGPWRRLGCQGAYLQLRGLEGITGLYVGKIEPGRMTEPERHLYEKVIYIVAGEGVAEIQQRDRVPQSICWQAGSLFSPPLNTLHRLINFSREPAVFLALTTAPMVLDHFHNEQFVFHSNFSFNERYDGETNYFEAGNERYLAADNRQGVWETNFISDVRQVRVDAQEEKGEGISIAQFEISNNTLIGQLAQWPVGRYHKAQRIDGGAVLIALRSQGYTLLWPSELGTRPYENGYGGQVERVNWMPGSVFSPPSRWFYQHFNTAAEPALQLALRCGSQKFPVGGSVSAIRTGLYTSIKQGAARIDYEDEDPEIRRQYQAALEKKGITPDMIQAVAVNDD